MILEAVDMPKLESPFVRVTTNNRHLVTPTIAEGYEWVFNDNNVLATEKLDGTDVSVIIEHGHIVGVYNRENRIDPWESDGIIVEAIRKAWQSGRLNLTDGQHFGEIVGPKVQGNPYKLTEHEWVPFRTYCAKKLAYNTWGKYPKTFEVISEWFRDGLWSLFYMQRHGGERVLAEGVVFHHADGRMAKLRRDMFDWYKGKGHKE